MDHTDEKIRADRINRRSMIMIVLGVLLCTAGVSDGLYKTTCEDDIQRLMLQYASNTSRLPNVLARAAMAGGRAGKHDNITVLTLSRE